MMESEARACEFCGAEEMSNAVLGTSATVKYSDGPPTASVPSAVLCYNCAQDVSDYLTARAETSNEDGPGLAPFGKEDAQALLDRLEENEHLVLELGRGVGYGICAVDGEWKHAVFRAPGPATIETLTRAEVRKLILDAIRLTLKHFDPSAWERYEHSR